VDLISARGLDILMQHFPSQGSKIKSILDQLESRGFFHGDLHSANLMIVNANSEQPIVYVIDFGVSSVPASIMH
jgi:tRNA A-37 threonylcarbamoyl transferase component Bud32